IDPEGRRPGAGVGLRLRYIEVDRVADLRVDRRRDRRVPVPIARPHRQPYVYLDATYIKARVAHRIVSRAVVVATAVTMDGNREVIGLDVCDSEDEVFWTAFPRGLTDQGLAG